MSHFSLLGRASRGRPGPLLACALLALPLAACGTVDRTVPTGTISRDYHERHPVVLANEAEPLDIFMVGASGRLDSRQMRDIDVFATEYRQRGQGSIAIDVPRGAVNGVDVDRTVHAVRRALADHGITGSVQLGSYPIADPFLASPLHLRYTRLQARVASRCGDWPDDLNSGATLHGWENNSYYNLGCATTQTLAAQIDDPRDLVRPRAEDPSDVVLRTRAIGLLRAGKDPGTVWAGSALQGISSVGGN
jgi:pilus assembly protein CpaD